MATLSIKNFIRCINDVVFPVPGPPSMAIVALKI